MAFSFIDIDMRLALYLYLEPKTSQKKKRVTEQPSLPYLALWLKSYYFAFVLK